MNVRNHRHLSDTLRRINDFSSKTNDLTPAMARSNVVLANLWEEAVNEFITQTDLSESERLSLRACDSPEAVFDVTKYNWSRKLNRRQTRNNQIAQKTVSQVLGLFRVIDVALDLASVVFIFINRTDPQAFPAASIFSGALKILLQVCLLILLF
jgi:hypothetical protein